MFYCEIIAGRKAGETQTQQHAQITVSCHFDETSYGRNVPTRYHATNRITKAVHASYFARQNNDYLFLHAHTLHILGGVIIRNFPWRGDVLVSFTWKDVRWLWRLRATVGWLPVSMEHVRYPWRVWFRKNRIKRRITTAVAYVFCRIRYKYYNPV